MEWGGRPVLCQSYWTGTGCANDSRRMHSLATRPHFTAVRFPARSILRVICVFAVILGSPVGQAVALGVAIETTPSGELFPAIELSQRSAHADPAQGTGLLRVRVAADAAPRDVRITLNTEGLLAPTVIEARIERELVLRPRLDWDVDALHGWREPRRQTLRVQVEAAGIEPVVRNVELSVHPLDEALYFVREGDVRVDLGWAFAAWVDPYHPVIDDVLALAGIDAGAQATPATDRATRLRQVGAIWTALEKRGLRYADEGAGITQGPNIYSQRVRLLSTTWQERVANCLDGSVLIASALERLGINSLIVLVPGHAFVGFRPDNGNREAEFLETTLLGQRARFAMRESEPDIERRAAAGFDAARAAAGAIFKRAASLLDGQHGPNYAIIDISTARTYGIMPLAVGRGDSTREVPVTSRSPVESRTQHSPLP